MKSIGVAVGGGKAFALPLWIFAAFGIVAFFLFRNQNHYFKM